MGVDPRWCRRLTGEEIMEETKKQAVKAWTKILPFGTQVVASAAAYSVGITATQVRLALQQPRHCKQYIAASQRVYPHV